MVAVATSTTLYVEYDVDINEWQAQFAEAAAHLEKERVTKGFLFELKRAYPVKIAQAKLVTSPREEVQIEANLSVQSDAGEDAREIGKSRVWISIPYQKSDFALPPADVAKRHAGRKRDVSRLLSAADPKEFALYARRVPKVTKGYDYYDFEDKLMDRDAFDARKRAVDEALENAVRRMHESVGQELETLQGAMLYLVKVPHADPKKNPHSNFFIDEPEGYPLATSDEEKVPF